MTAEQKASKPVANLVINGANKMTKEKRQRLAAWLRQCAEDVRVDGDKYTGRFVARLTR